MPELMSMKAAGRPRVAARPTSTAHGRARPAPQAALSPGCVCPGSCPRCTGHALPQPLRHAMEQRLGAALGDVRIHTGATAAAAAAAQHAAAYTRGSDIVFGAGRYAPQHAAGATLLAHELVHVLQQRAGRRGAPPAPAAAAEAEARRLAAPLAGGAPAQVRSAAPPATVQRQDEAEAAAPSPDAPGPGDAALDPWWLRQWLRWWLGSTLLEGAPPSGPLLPAAPTLLPPDFFSPLPPDPLALAPDVGAPFSEFHLRAAGVGRGDDDVALGLYRRNLDFARRLPDLRGAVPRPLRWLVPTTWRRDIAGALTGAAVSGALKRDFPTPIEVSDRAFEAMTGAGTTVIPLPSISFDLF